MKAFVLSFCIALSATPALAQGRSELIQKLSPDQARSAAQSGQQQPLEQLLPRIREQVGEGQVLATELEDRNGRRIYVLRWKAADRLLNLEVDAVTGDVLRAE